MAEFSDRHVVLPQAWVPIVAEPDVLVVGALPGWRRPQNHLRRQAVILQ